MLALPAIAAPPTMRPFLHRLYPNTSRHVWIHSPITLQSRFKTAANHDEDVTPRWKEFCYRLGITAGYDRMGAMKLSLKRFVPRSIVDGPDLGGLQAPASPRSVKRKMALIALAGTLAVVGAATGAYYFAMRPVTLRFAVGPQNSDDVKGIQAFIAAYARENYYSLLRPGLTTGAPAS